MFGIIRISFMAVIKSHGNSQRRVPLLVEPKVQTTPYCSTILLCIYV